jgi:hypothetical protein
MDIDPADEADFNRWYDREHLAERVAIEGFVEARRYVAQSASLKYLSLYSTETFEVLDSPAYRTALASQTDWSKANIARFRNMLRSVARITVSRGQGRGAVLGIVRIRPGAGQADALRTQLRACLDPAPLDSVISMHLIEGDSDLSRPLGVPDADVTGAGDWFALIDGTDTDAVARAMATCFDKALADTSSRTIASGTYRLMWDLAKRDL